MNTTAHQHVVPGEEELGVQKRCHSCGEWWPLDSDFWYVMFRAGRLSVCHGRVAVRRHDVYRNLCKACHDEYRTAYAQRRRAA